MGRRKQNKFGNIKTMYHGITFDSQRECARYKELKLLEGAGHITELELQPKFALKCGGVDILLRSKRYHRGRRASYRADFSYWDIKEHEQVVEDVKGFMTPLSGLKIGIVEAEYGVRVKIVR